MFFCRVFWSGTSYRPGHMQTTWTWRINMSIMSQSLSTLLNSYLPSAFCSRNLTVNEASISHTIRSLKYHTATNSSPLTLCASFKYFIHNHLYIVSLATEIIIDETYLYFFLWYFYHMTLFCRTCWILSNFLWQK